MKIKTIHEGKDYGPACLHIESRPVWNINNKVKKFIVKLAKIMAKHNGVGIAAPQVGRNIRICLVADYEHHGILTIINPVIQQVSEEKNVEVEGCLSCPGREVVVKRHNWIDIQYESFDNFSDEGYVVNTRLSGLLARVAQHEIEHLNGILIVNHEEEKGLAQWAIETLERKKSEW